MRSHMGAAFNASILKPTDIVKNDLFISRITDNDSVCMLVGYLFDCNRQSVTSHVDFWFIVCRKQLAFTLYAG